MYDDDNKISELYDMRLQKKLTDPPKQWHFYNCLRLNQLSLCIRFFIETEQI